MDHSNPHARNTLFLGSVEAFWGAGLNVISLGTVLPVFLDRLGAGYGLIALLPALSALGIGVPQLLSSFVAGESRRLKGWMVGLHLSAPLPLGGVALCLWKGWGAPLPVVLAGWGAFCLAVGLIIPLWFDYMASILRPERRGRAFGIIFFIQTLAGAGGVTLAAWLLEKRTTPSAYALLFALAWAAMTAGALLFLGTRETAGGAELPPRRSLHGHLASMAGLVRRKDWLRRYLSARWLVKGSYPLVLNFYAVYAVSARGVTPATAALYGTAALGTQALAGVAAGLLGDRLGHKAPVILGQCALLAATVLLLLPLPDSALFVAAALTGAFLGTEYTSQTNWLIDLSGNEERRSLLALVGFLLMPAAVLAPVAGGLLMDLVGFKPVAAAVCLFTLGAMVLESIRVPNRASD